MWKEGRGFRNLGFRVLDERLWVWGLGLRVQGLRFCSLEFNEFGGGERGLFRVLELRVRVWSVIA